MTRLRYLGDDYCEVFDHGFLPLEWVGRRELTAAQLAALAANPQFEADLPPTADAPVKAIAKPPVKKPVKRRKAKPRGRPFAKKPSMEAHPCPPAAPS